MIVFIDYIRSMFCKHDWHVEEIWKEVSSDFGTNRKGYKVYMRCKICGHHKSHWKV